MHSKGATVRSNHHTLGPNLGVSCIGHNPIVYWFHCIGRIWYSTCLHAFDSAIDPNRILGVLRLVVMAHAKLFSRE
jgi:hypothetical protein